MAARVGSILVAAGVALWSPIVHSASEPEPSVHACAAVGGDRACAAPGAEEEEEVGFAQLRRLLVRPPPPETTGDGDLRSCLKAAGLAALYPGDEGFEQSRRLHNYRVEHLVIPNATVSVTSSKEVQFATVCARKSMLPAFGTSGMNAYEAFCTKGCVLVLAAGLKRVDVNATARTAVLGPGLNNGEMYYHLANAPGGPFALPSGTNGIVGLGGIALGGGKGYVTRQAGLLSDHIYAVDIVLWNGSIAHASEDENPDLLWVCRGGGGLQVPGIVVALHFNLIDAPSNVCAFHLDWDLGHSKQVIASWQKHMVMSSDTRLHVRLEPNMFGNKRISLAGWLVDGRCDEAKALVQPALAELPQGSHDWTDFPWLDAVKQTSGLCDQWNCNLQPGHQCLSDEALINTPGSNTNGCGYDRGYNTPIKHRGLVFPKLLDDAGINKLVELFSDPPKDGYNGEDYKYQGFYVQVDPTNGKAAEVASNSTAYPWRSQEGMTLQLVIKFADNVKNDLEWEDFSYRFINELLPWSPAPGSAHGESYINYLDKNSPLDPSNEIMAEYWGPNAQRLADILLSYEKLDPIGHCYWTYAGQGGCTMRDSN